MPASAPAKVVEKSPRSLVITVGSHPIVYSVTTILAIGTAVFFLAIAPMVRMLQPGGSASLSDAQTTNQAANDKLDSQKKLIDAVGSIQKSDRDLLAYALPDLPDAPGLAIQLNSIAIKSGVRMSGMDVTAGPEQTSSEAPARPQSVKTLNISYTVENINYDKLKILLSNLEYSLRIFDVLSLSFTPSSGAVSLQLRTYYINNG